MADNCQSALNSLPSLTFSQPFLRGRYITAEHIKFLKKEGFLLQMFPGDSKSNRYYRNLTINGKDSKDDVTIVIDSFSISIRYRKIDFNNFKISFKDFGSFAASYEEAVKRVYNL